MQTISSKYAQQAMSHKDLWKKITLFLLSPLLNLDFALRGLIKMGPKGLNVQ